MTGKNNRPDVTLTEDGEGWLHVGLKTGGCTSIGFEVPDDPELAHRLIKILQDRFPSS